MKRHMLTVAMVYALASGCMYADTTQEALQKSYSTYNGLKAEYQQALEKAQKDAGVEAVQEKLKLALQDFGQKQQAAIDEYNQNFEQHIQEQVENYRKQQDILEQLISAIMSNDEKQLDEFFANNKDFDVNTCDPIGFTPLHYAAALFNVDAAKKLIEKGADVNACAGMLGYTPLDGAMSVCLWNRILVTADKAEQDMPEITSSCVFQGQGLDGRIVLVWSNDQAQVPTENAAQQSMIKLLEDNGAQQAEIIAVVDGEVFGLLDYLFGECDGCDEEKMLNN